MEAWTQAEITALASRDKVRIWLVELVLAATVYRASQSIRDLTDDQGRVWQAHGANGEVQGMGTGLGRRPREVTIALHGLDKGQSLYARTIDAGALGAPGRISMAWVTGSGERLIVQPRLRFAGIVVANPVVTLGETDRVTLILKPGTARANRLAAPWDRSPASHRAFAGLEDTVFDRVTTHTQQPVAV